MGVFKKGLRDEFMTALAELAQKQGWWQDVLHDASLIIAVRDEELDVYWNGQSLFHAKFKDGRVEVNTHVKYLLDPDLSDRVPLKADGTFDLKDVKPTPILTRYETGTLRKLKRAADMFSGMEKQGVHALVQTNENVIDVEITLDASDLPDVERNHPRIDIAMFEQRPEGVELVFWEAKLFANKELRAKGDSQPKVVGQIKDYKNALKAHQYDVISSYICVAKNLVKIAEMSGGVRNVGPAIRAVADGGELKMGPPANVGLVIFGFDADQNAEDSIGDKHLKKLKKLIGPGSLRTSGKPDGLKLSYLWDDEEQQTNKSE